MCPTPVSTSSSRVRRIGANFNILLYVDGHGRVHGRWHDRVNVAVRCATAMIVTVGPILSNASHRNQSLGRPAPWSLRPGTPPGMVTRVFRRRSYFSFSCLALGVAPERNPPKPDRRHAQRRQAITHSCHHRPTAPKSHRPPPTASRTTNHAPCSRV